MILFKTYRTKNYNNPEHFNWQKETKKELKDKTVGVMKNRMNRDTRKYFHSEQYLYWGNSSVPKSNTSKINNIHTDIEPSLHTQFSIPECSNILIINILYKENQHSLAQGCLYQNVPIIPLHVLLTRRIETFWSGGCGTVWHRKSQMKNHIFPQKYFYHTNFS